MSAPPSLRSVCLLSLWGGLLGSVLTLGGMPVQAQEFDFTKPEDSAASPGSGVPTMPVLPTAQSAQNEDLASPSGSFQGGVNSLPPATVPPNPTSPLSPVLPNLAAPAPANPVAAGSSASQQPYTYERIPGITPAAPVGGVVKGQLPPGTQLPLTVYREITFPPFQAINGQLEVSDPVTDSSGQVVIPAGSVVWGTFQPILKEQDPEDQETGADFDRVIGNRFVASRITIQNATYLLQGQSEPLPLGMDPNADLGTTAIRGAGYGAAGGLALGVLTGGVGFIPILAGGLAGAAAGTTNVDRVVTLETNSILNIELTNPLIIQ